MAIIIGLGGRVAYKDARIKDKRTLVKQAARNKVSLQFTDLSRLDLGGLFLQGADLVGASLRHTAMRGVDLRYSNLLDVDFNGSDLANAKLEGAQLSSWSLVNARNVSMSYAQGAVLDGMWLEKTPLLFQMAWPVLITEQIMRIGCELHHHNSWKGFEPEDIIRMGIGALNFWRRYREPLLQWCAYQVRCAEGDFRESRQIPAALRGCDR